MKKAFTLAEVLITLAIIGVVAALTVFALNKIFKIFNTRLNIKKLIQTLQLSGYKC